MAKLEVLRGTEALITWRLTPGRTTVGRADTSDFLVPDDDVSRTHCLIECRDGEWRVRDRSRHGTWVAGRRVEGSATLAHGDVLEVGSFRLRFSLDSDTQAGRTASHRAIPRAAEQLVSQSEEGGLAVERPVLRVHEGPGEGLTFELDRPRQFVGSGEGDLAVADPLLVERHLAIEVSVGRAMLVPGRGPTFLEGLRVVDRTPVYAGDRIRLGDTVVGIKTELAEQAVEAESFGEMVGRAPVSRQLFGMLRRIARHTAPVLLIGESGTGKELAARGLHDESPRADGPFVAVNCGAITESLFEAELFGHEKGAFTGATSRRDGAFQAAHRGTLFLDEIGELPEASQAKLLRALETGEVRRVGSTSVSHPDARVVAATNRNLQEDVEAGLFRQDLFFRLAVLAIRMPPLRERIEELPELAAALCQRLGSRAEVTPEGLTKLTSHTWPGNVRELRNVLTRGFVLGGPVIGAGDVRFSPWAFEGTAAPTETEPGAKGALQAAERRLIEDALRRHQGNRSAVARELGLARSTLHYKLTRFRLDKTDF